MNFDQRDAILASHLFYTLLVVHSAFKTQGFSWWFPRLSIIIIGFPTDLGSAVPEATPPQPSLKDFHDISYTTCDPLPTTYPAGRGSDVALLGCNLAAQ